MQKQKCSFLSPLRGKRRVSDKKGGYKGFTLIELVVVVLIIGILAAVAVPQYQKAVTRSKLATIKHLVETIAKAEELYYLTDEKYTKDIAKLDINLPTPLQSDIKTGTYVYPWGRCILETGINAFCSCRITLSENLSLGYEKKYEHSTIMTNRKICVVYGTDSAEQTTTYAHRACLEDTQTTSWSCGGGNYCFLYYR